MVRVELRGAALPRDPAALDDRVAIREPDESLDVLVGHEQRMPGGAELVKASPDLLPDEWRESFGCFIQDEEMRVGHQSAADGEHLLLTPGELVAHVLRARRETREEPIYPRERPRIARAAAVAREGHEVLAHREVRKDLPALGHHRDAEPTDPIGCEPLDRLAAEAHRAPTRRREPEDRSHGRGLAHAVATEQRRHLACAHREAHAEQHLARAIRGLDVAHLEQLAHRRILPSVAAATAVRRSTALARSPRTPCGGRAPPPSPPPPPRGG